MTKISDLLGIGSDNVRQMAAATVDDNLGRADVIEAIEEASKRVPTELDERPPVEADHAPLFLCLDMRVGHDFRGIVHPPESAETVPDVMLWIEKMHRESGVNSPASPRCTWRLFRTLEEATEYADSSPTIAMMPLHIEPNPELGF